MGQAQDVRGSTGEEDPTEINAHFKPSFGEVSNNIKRNWRAKWWELEVSRVLDIVCHHALCFSSF